MFDRFCAVFHHHFGARKFVMRRYQVGHQNPEGIEAGSFWFYYKLGFRSLARSVRREADAESARLARRKGARSAPQTLRRLAKSDMLLATDGTPPERFRDVQIRAVGLAVTRAIRLRAGGDRAAALARAVRTVGRALGAADVPERFAPVAALVPDLGRWESAERRALLELLKAKEAPRERAFVLASQRHTRWRRWLLDTFPTRGT